jgi:Cytochrome P450
MQAIELILGGTDTSAFTLTMGIFRILGSPESTRKLVACLDEHISKPGIMVPLTDLEKIDYLVSDYYHPHHIQAYPPQSHGF